MGQGGFDVVVDTRRDPTFPRNAVHASFAWDRLWFDTHADTWRRRADLRGYVGLIGQSVLVVRGQHEWASDRLPPFERFLLGGAASLRGFRAGARTGDRLAAASAEVRMPISSPLRLGRAGIAMFADTGATSEAGTSLGDARFDTGVGGGFFVSALMFSLRVDVAHGIGGGTRAHVTLGAAF